MSSGFLAVVPGMVLCLTLFPVSSLARDLPTLNARASQTSVSGLSSGGFMTVQYGVAFSATVKGLGVIAAGPYNCAYVNWGGISTCMTGSPSGAYSWLAAKGFASLGQIDPVANLARMKVYVFSGTEDDKVYPSVVDATQDFFVKAGVSKSNLYYENKIPAGHAFIAPGFGNPCAANAAPYIDQCQLEQGNYDQPLAVLQHIYGPLKPAARTLSSAPQTFNQKAFASEMSGMDEEGYVYIPKMCASDSRNCAVHVVFHGCKQGAKVVGNDVYEKLGYNNWADTNNLIVLYPQISATSVPFNPDGCWDWWGFSGLNFQVRSGSQLAAVKAMVDRLTTPDHK